MSFVCKSVVCMNKVLVLLSLLLFTFWGKAQQKANYKLAEKYGYKVVEIIIKSNFKNIHGVPAEKVEKQRQRFEF